MDTWGPEEASSAPVRPSGHGHLMPSTASSAPAPSATGSRCFLCLPVWSYVLRGRTWYPWLLFFLPPHCRGLSTGPCAFLVPTRHSMNERHVNDSHQLMLWNY